MKDEKYRGEFIFSGLFQDFEKFQDFLQDQKIPGHFQVFQDFQDVHEPCLVW